MTVENNLSHTKQGSIIRIKKLLGNERYRMLTMLCFHRIINRDILSFIIQFLLKSISDLTQDYIFGIKLHL